jgi:uncharacterized protein (TIGR03084 family)
MAVDFPRLLADLRAETDALLACLAGLRADQWDQPTPAAGWAIRDQVSHLAFFDDVAHLALIDAVAFRAEAERLSGGGMDFPDRVAEQHRAMTPPDLTKWFTSSRARLLAAFASEDPRRRLPWFGPDMSVASSATARLMETWAHGQDVYDTVGVAHPESTGLRSIAHLGVSTFGFAHRLNGLEIPDDPIRVELRGPDSDEIWCWGPAYAHNRVVGRAEDFVLVVTQRRHAGDTALVIQGDVASAWMDIAQAFAGAPGRRRRPPITASS